MAMTTYENFILENKMTDLVNTKLDARSLMTTDFSLAESAGLKKVVNKYTYSGAVEQLAKGAKNTTKGSVTFTPTEYTVKRYQQTFTYNDMEVMQDPYILDVATNGASVLMANQIKTEYFAELAKIGNTFEYDTTFNYATVVDALAQIDKEVETDMFNMFSNGAKAGVFDVDKLGDAVKEFGIRCKDGSNTTIEAFESLGFNADELQQKFAQGGESAQDAFQEVVTALNNCDDEVVKNTAGVNLFGTMWEDMGADAVKALTDTNGEFDKTADNLNKIKEIKYDSLENAFEGIKRQIETGLVLPIGEKLLPKLNEFANYINDNMPDIKNTVESVMDGICSAISFVTDNLNIIIPILAAAVAGFTAFQIISTIAPLFTMIQTAIAGTTTVQAALNAVMVANPFGAVAVALAALVAAGVALYMNWDTIKTKCEELLAKVTEVWTNIKTAVFNKIEEIKDAINDKLSYFKNAGKNLFNALWDGLKEVWNNLKSWVSDKVDWIKDKLSVWKKAKDKMSGSDGSHRTGLQEVPFDGYRAILHKGEMVLTQPEAERYKKGNEGNRTENFNVYIGTVENKDERTTEDFMREMEFYRKRRVSAVGGAV